VADGGRDLIRAALAALLVVTLTAACEQPQQVQKAVERDLPSARVERARGGAQSIAVAIHMYATNFGALPDSLDDLTRETAKDGVVGGPFLVVVPAPPSGWAEYRYERKADGTFAVTSAGDGISVTAP
jgi:hypothetical protein